MFLGLDPEKRKRALEQMLADSLPKKEPEYGFWPNFIFVVVVLLILVFGDWHW